MVDLQKFDPTDANAAVDVAEELRVTRDWVFRAKELLKSAYDSDLIWFFGIDDFIKGPQL
jgi:hypothetical protein